MSRQYEQPPAMTIDPEHAYRAIIHTERGDIVLRLMADVAPLTVNNFVFLACNGFYDGLTFHRVIHSPPFMIQGGDPDGTGTGGPGYKLKAEFNDMKHDKGVLSMARTNDPNSGPNRSSDVGATRPSGGATH